MSTKKLDNPSHLSLSSLLESIKKEMYTRSAIGLQPNRREPSVENIDTPESPLVG